jgi:hypothetical protein
VSIDPANDARPYGDHRPRSICGGLALPPRQLPPPAPRTVELEVTPDAATRIVVGFTDALGNAVDAVRRAVATLGIS